MGAVPFAGPGDAVFDACLEWRHRMDSLAPRGGGRFCRPSLLR